MKHLFRRVSLTLCLILLCSTILGTAASAHTYEAYAHRKTIPEITVSDDADNAINYGEQTFNSFEDLKVLASRTYSEYTRYRYVGEQLVITEDITIPENLEILADYIIVQDGSTVTLYGDLTVWHLIVHGTLVNNGWIFLMGGSEVQGTLINNRVITVARFGGMYGELFCSIGEYMGNGTIHVSSEDINKVNCDFDGLNEYDFVHYRFRNEDENLYVLSLYGYFDSDAAQDPYASVPLFRMYDSNSGEHFYSGSTQERFFLLNAGWQYEGVGFNFPTEGASVYRLYEPVSGEHLYTMDQTEVQNLLDAGWNNEGVAFNSAGRNEVPQYRLHNPNTTRGGYHFTGSNVERDILVNAGWIYQGIGWYSCME